MFQTLLLLSFLIRITIIIRTLGFAWIKSFEYNANEPRNVTFWFQLPSLQPEKKYENLRTTRQKHFEVQTNNEKKVMILDRNVEF